MHALIACCRIAAASIAAADLPLSVLAAGFMLPLVQYAGRGMYTSCLPCCEPDCQRDRTCYIVHILAWLTGPLESFNIEFQASLMARSRPLQHLNQDAG